MAISRNWLGYLEHLLFDINHGYLGLCQNLKNRYLNRVKSEQLYDWRCFDVVIYADTDHDHVGGNDCQD